MNATIETGRAELLALKRAYPLARRWQRLDDFMETVDIAGTIIHSVGLLASAEGGQDVTGSAAGKTHLPVDRAYFELLERAATLDGRESGLLELLTSDGGSAGYAASKDVFPENTEPQRFRYSLSNGVAASTTLERACAAAHAELVERDRILRSWFGGPAPIRVRPTPESALSDSTHEVEWYRLPELREKSAAELEVAAVVAFPKREDVPFVLGTAAAGTFAEAVQGAERECVQRLAFLWGEPIPDDLPAFEPTPSFHQELYLCPRMHFRIRSWLDGAHDLGAHEPGTHEEPITTSKRRLFANLTPPSLRGRLWVVKAIPDAELTLAFGHQHPGVDPRLQSCGVHPIS